MRAHHRRGAVRWDLVRLLAPGILVGALLGAQVAGWMPGRVLAAFFGAFVGYSAIQMLRGGRSEPTGSLPGTPAMLGAGGAIGSIYRVHRATASRWLVRAREALLDGVRRSLMDQLGANAAEVESILVLVHSQLDLSLSRILKPPGE